MEKEIVLFPLPAMGHLNPMVEFGKLLLRRGLSVTILIFQFPAIDNRAIDSYISGVSAANSSLSIRRLPFPPSSPAAGSLVDLVRLALPILKDYLSASPACAIILDFFFDAGLDVAAELRVPCYFFFASSASNLAAFLYLPTLHHQITDSFKDLGDTPIHFPGFPRPISASDMPNRISDRTTELYKNVIVQFERLAGSAGIIVNSFRSLEPKALSAIASGLCFPGRLMAPVYSVGPITATDNRGDKETGSELRHGSLAWLDGQPSGSVVFLCFGSMGGLPEAQLREIAVGLERSGQRFLWVVRCGTQLQMPNGVTSPGKEMNLDAVLPEGFVERTRGRGLVVSSWAPQVSVLGHTAVGGFVTHCGWNSVLESIVAGVAMIAWPMYAEQRMNKVFLVEEARLAVEMRGYKNELVRAEEVEEKVRWLMESEGGKELRARAAAAGESGREAMREGGASYEDVLEVVRAITIANGGGVPAVDRRP
nr:putative glycosyltransferase [Anoectochilus roxburghii]